jgi:cytochrome c oxidase assembly factor CtaG
VKRRVYALLLLFPALALAHSGEAIQPHDLWSAWEFDPGTAIPLAISAVLYLRGARVSRGATRLEQILFWSGWATLFIALVSPLHPLGEALFSAHMTQHEILMLISAPLLVLSRPLAPMLWGMPISWRRWLGQAAHATAFQKLWRAVTRPSVAWCVHAVALWTWHIPALFDATLSSEWIHAAQHASFFGSALLFWWSLFAARGMHAGAGVLYIFTTAIHTSILGALLTFAPFTWYPPYASTTRAWGLSPLEDQQLGGLIMWVPAGLVYIATGLALFARWLKESEQMVLRSSCAN